jgi:O-Antigen ligase
VNRRKVEWLDHGVALSVAVGLLAGAFAGGGYGPERSAAAGVVVWCVVAAALLASGAPHPPASRAGRWLAALLAAFALLSGVSAAWADDSGRALGSATPAILYAGLAALVAVTAARVAATAWIRGVALGLLLVGAAALASRFLPDAFPDALADALPAARPRLSYPIGYWNALGFAMAGAAIALAWLSCRAATRGARAAALAALPIPALALYLTSSRGALVALLAGLAVLLALERRRLALALALLPAAAGSLAVVAVAAARPAFADGAVGALARQQARTVFVVLVVACAALALVRALLDGALARTAAWRAPRPLGLIVAAAAGGATLIALLAADLPGRFDAFRTPPAAPAGDRTGLVTSHLLSSGGSGRYQLWSAAWEAFRERPLHGLGTGGYEAWWTQHGSLALPVRNAHSLPFETLAELGLLGGLPLLLIGGFVAVAAGRRRHADAGGVLAVALALAAYGAVAATVDWTWQVPVALAPALLGAAIALGLPAGRDSAAALRLRWRGAALLASGLAVAAAGTVLATEVQLERSRAAVRSGDLPAAAAAAAAAAAVQPWAAAPRLQLALVEERRGKLAGALRAASLARARSPRDWRIWLVTARLRVKAGEMAGARAALARVRCLRPHAGFRPLEAIAFRRSIPGRKEPCVERSDRDGDRARAAIRAGHRGAGGDRAGLGLALAKGLAAATDAGARGPRRRDGGDDRAGGGHAG